MKIKKTFNNRSFNWDRNPVFNEMFLNSQMVYFEELRRARGFVFLQEVYTSLGLPITKISSVYGWGSEERFEFQISRIGETADYELIFECFPILKYLEDEDRVLK